MAGLTIHSEKLTPALAKELSALCPFGALEETAEGLAVGAGCKMCRLCVKKSSGVITEEETPKPQINKEEWVGVAVFADFAHGGCIRHAGAAGQGAGIGCRYRAPGLCVASGRR